MLDKGALIHVETFRVNLGFVSQLLITFSHQTTSYLVWNDFN